MSDAVQILLTHSYHLGYDRKQMRKMQPYLPLGTLYAAAVLRDNEFSVSVFDPMLQEPIEGFAQALRENKPSVVVIYEDDFNFLTKMCLTRMRELAWHMIAEARKAGARVVVHGSDATDHAKDYLAQGCDYVLVGEAEATLVDVVRKITSGASPSGGCGIVRKANSSSRAGAIGLEPAAAARRPVLPLPLPARDLVDITPYRDAWNNVHGHFSMNIVASRGCPFRCNWCAKPIFGDTYNVRDAADVAEEMAILKKSYGATHLWFADDIFGLNRHWVEKLASEVEIREAAVPFKIQARADLIDARVARNLKRAGCAEIWMGVESGSQKMLDAMEKGLKLSNVRNARRVLRAEGIRAGFFLQFGYPGETWDDLQQTIRLVRQLRPDDIGISFSYPLPNTRFYERVRGQLGAKQNWSDSEDLCVMFKGAYNDGFYRAVRDALHAEVDSWRAGSGHPEFSAAAISAMWERVDELEPQSRNADATELWDEPQNENRCGKSFDGLIPIQIAAPQSGGSQ